MIKGHLYFLKDEYFADFPDSNIMQNKETINGIEHKRPCFYAFCDTATGIYWMIPLSSKTGKYQKEYQKKFSKYGFCDTIIFGDVLGHQKVFLIQNMCPVTQNYIHNEYIDKASQKPVQLNGVFEKNLVKKAKKVLALTRAGKKLIFPDVLLIEQELLEAAKTSGSQS